MSNTWRNVALHLVWATQDRRALIDEHCEIVIAGTILDRAHRMRSEILAFGAAVDHVHVLVRLHPAVSVSRFVRAAKSASSSAVANTSPRDPPFRWQRGYAVLSVDPRNTFALCDYIARQREHHGSASIESQWEPPLDCISDDESDE